jgi:hypothetical protein
MGVGRLRASQAVASADLYAEPRRRATPKRVSVPPSRMVALVFALLVLRGRD